MARHGTAGLRTGPSGWTVAAPAALSLVLSLVLGACDIKRGEDGAFRLAPLDDVFGDGRDSAAAPAPRRYRGPDTARSSGAGFDRARIETDPLGPDDDRDALTETEFFLSTAPTAGAHGVPDTAGLEPGGPAYRVDEAGTVHVNFVDADVRDVVDVVMGDILGANYVVDPRVEGRVTLRIVEPIPKRDVIPTLQNVLALNGIALQQVGQVYTVLPTEAAGGLNRPVIRQARGEGGQGISTHVFQLRHAEAAAIQEIVQPFVGPGRQLTINADQNALIFVGNSVEAESLLDLVGIFDVNWMAGMSAALIPVEAADASTVTDELETIFRRTGAKSADDPVRFLPVERLNAVLVTARDFSTLRQAEQWVARLDRADAGADQRIFVYYVKNGKATELAGVLNQVFQADLQAPQPPAAQAVPGLAPGLIPATLRSDAPRGDGDHPGDAYPDGIPFEGAPSVEVSPDGVLGLRPPRITNNLAARAPSRIDPSSLELERRSRAGSGIGIGALVLGGQGIRIIPDERNNALVVLSTLAQFRTIEAALKRLDVLPLQVLIEATIAEVSLDDELRFGLKWFLQGDEVEATFSNLAGGAVSPVFPGFSFLADIPNARVVLDALSEVADVRVISSPQIMVLDNQSARLQVGDQVPVATQSAVAVVDPDAPIVNSIELLDTGVILEVTPRVNVSGLVELDVIQEVSDAVATDTSGIDSPTIQQRQVTSTVAVQSGETVALGGLIRDRETRGKTATPGLADIPVLGHLFKSQSAKAERTELLILITPHVVRDPREAREVTEQLRRRLRTVVPLEGVIE